MSTVINFLHSFFSSSKVLLTLFQKKIFPLVRALLAIEYPKMSIPALRQPKAFKVPPKTSQNLTLAQSYMILTLRNNSKLVVTTDAYHGLVNEGDVYKCVFCGVVLHIDDKYKESHVNSATHIDSMRSLPYTVEYAEHLIRQLSKDNYYCGICNVIVTAPFMKRHIDTEAHLNELEKAQLRVPAYSPL